MEQKKKKESQMVTIKYKLEFTADSFAIVLLTSSIWVRDAASE